MDILPILNEHKPITGARFTIKKAHEDLIRALKKNLMTRKSGPCIRRAINRLNVRDQDPTIEENIGSFNWMGGTFMIWGTWKTLNITEPQSGTRL